MVTYVLNVLKSIFFCLDIRQLQKIFTSQTILDVSFSVIVSFINFGFRMLDRHTYIQDKRVLEYLYINLLARYSLPHIHNLLCTLSIYSEFTLPGVGQNLNPDFMKKRSFFCIPWQQATAHARRHLRSHVPASLSIIHSHMPNESFDVFLQH